jgi:hypothetical protein
MPDHTKIKPASHRMPEHSVLYNRLIPIALLLLGVVMFLLIVFAIGVVTGLIHWA